MATRTLQHYTRPIKGRKTSPLVRYKENRIHKPNQTLRVSKLKFEPKAILSFENTKLLFKLNEKHNEVFDSSLKIEPTNINTILINGLQNVIPFNLNDIFINNAQDSFIISESLKFDFYVFELKPFLNLKHKAPKLYQAFKTVIDHLRLPIAEHSETPYFDEDYIDYYKEEENETELYDAYQKIKTKLDVLSTCNKRADTIDSLNKYKPKNALYIEIKDFLIKALHFSPNILLHNYPFSFFNGNPYAEEVTPLYSRCFLTYSMDSSVFEAFINEAMNNYYSNYLLDEPCSVINLNEVNNVKNQIVEFETFANTYSVLTDKLNKL